MSYLAVCRVCLSDNVKINSIQNTQLQVIYEKLSNCKLNSEDERPTLVCYICYSQLQRCNGFLEKSRKSAEILVELSINGIEITPTTVAMINKGIQSNFCITPIEYATYSCSEIATSPAVKDELDINDIEITIKEEIEVKVENSDVCSVCLTGNVRIHSIKNTPLQVIFERLTKCTKVKIENMPMSICFICHRLLKKCWMLSNKCKKSQNILNELLYNGVQLTQSVISILTRRSKSTYSITPVKYTSFCSTVNDNVSVKTELIEDCAIVKQEIEDEYIPAIIDEVTVQTGPDQKTNIKKNIIVDIALYEQCDLCDFKSNSAVYFKRHLRLHDPKRKFPCDICSYRFALSHHLSIHKSNVHNYKFECNKCNKEYKSHSDLKRHYLVHTAETLYPCEICMKTFGRRNNLRCHYDRVHRGLRYPCGRCKCTYSNLNLLQDHILRKHGRSPYFICDICHKTLCNKSGLIRHLRNHEMQATYQCRTCFKIFSTSQNLRLHYMTHNTDKPFKCDKCVKSYNDHHRLKTHMQTHSETRQFSCNICNKEFHRRDILKTHMTRHTAEKIFSCDLCDLKFINNTYVKKHMVTHSDNRPYSCNVCCKSFKLAPALKTHMLVHVGKKTYICDNCNKAFTSKNYLISHMRYHLGVKPYACRWCDKNFYTKQGLIMHTRTHTGDKPFACSMCNRCFSQSSSLKRHLDSHNKKKYSCDICDKNLADKNSLKRHKISAHARATKYVCDLCNKVFIDKSKVTEHLTTHDTETPFKCDSCCKSFYNLSSLTQHIKLHIGEKSYCPFCVAAFDSKYTLDRHNISAHRGVKRYACNICEQAFDGLLRLNSHIRSHTGSKQFSCELCVKTYVERRDLMHHMKLIHNRLQCFV